MSEDEYEYPPEKCPVCGGSLQWVQYGFSIWMGTDEERAIYSRYYHSAGCVLRKWNRFCPVCQKYHRAAEGNISESEGSR